MKPRRRLELLIAALVGVYLSSVMMTLGADAEFKRIVFWVWLGCSAAVVVMWIFAKPRLPTEAKTQAEFFAPFRAMQDKMMAECGEVSTAVKKEGAPAGIAAMQKAVVEGRWPTPENAWKRMEKEFPDWCKVARERFPIFCDKIENGRLD